MADSITADQIKAVYRALLRREPESQAVIDFYLDSAFTLEAVITTIAASDEYIDYNAPVSTAGPPADAFSNHNGMQYTVPADLRSHDTQLQRVLLVGSCLLSGWSLVIQRRGILASIDHVLISPDPPPPPYPFDAYSFQIVQIPLRSVFPDADYAEWLRSSYDDTTATERVLSHAYGQIDYWLENVLRWSNRIVTFVPNFMTPQYNVNGRFFHGDDRTSNIYLVEQLNRYLESRLAERENVYLLDIDHLAGVFGRRYVQDDSVWTLPHGSLISDFDYMLDRERIVPVVKLSEHYTHQTADFICSVWLEAEAMHRSLRQMDAVKMVCVDLDDTLWRGVLAEQELDAIEPGSAIEGWPLGIVEALLALRRRGIILALVSKNDLERVRAIWPRVFTRELTLDDFAIVKVSWNDKAQSIREALMEANLLPRNVVFLDDNPAERANVTEAFPDIRVVSASHYYWKRILMWSAETQGYAITSESKRRSEMIKSQGVREAQRKTMSRDEFVANLELKAIFFWVGSRNDPRFIRTLELLNKTNQFNTTGRRWTAGELHDMCNEGAVLVGEVSDRHAFYGLVVVVVASRTTIEQVVMSCRVIGLDVEIAAVALITEMLLQNGPIVVARAKDTESNLLSRNLFEKSGWHRVDGHWRTDLACAVPHHIAVTLPAEAN